MTSRRCARSPGDPGRVRRRLHADGSALGRGVRSRQARPQRYLAGDDLSARGRGRPGDDGGALPARGHATRAARAQRVTVTVHMHGNLRRFMPGGADRLDMTLAAGTTIEALLADLGAERDTWLVAVNGATVETGRVLEAGDLLDCFEPVAGGRGEEM